MSIEKDPRGYPIVYAKVYAALDGRSVTAHLDDRRRGYCKLHIQNDYGKQHPLYYTWSNMRRRCYDTRHHNYKYYGARGIRVCARWYYSFTNFVDDMGEKPDNMTLDRIDSNKNYSPENCRWATYKQQIDNREYRSTYYRKNRKEIV